MSLRRRTQVTARRAGALIAALIALVWINLAVIGAVAGAGDDARLSAWRVQSVQAAAAAESGVRIAMKLQAEAPDTPAVGVIELPGGVIVTIEDAFEASPEAPGAIVTEASVGECVQRCERTWNVAP